MITGHEDAGTVIIVDDEPLVRKSMDSLFRSVGLETRSYASARDLLDETPPATACCMVVDIRMPMMSGLEFHKHLKARGIDRPVIFMTGHGDIPMSVQAMKAGALDFLVKPFRDQDILDAVAAALSHDAARLADERKLVVQQGLYAKLTQREREVMVLVARGLLNKQVAAELGISEITVKLHRAKLMKKMAIKSLPDLVRLADLLRP